MRKDTILRKQITRSFGDLAKQDESLPITGRPEAERMAA
jgi:hypothetical protein